MDLSPYIKHLPLILRVGAFLDPWTITINYLALSYTMMCWGMVVLTDLYTLDPHRRGMPVRAIYEAFLFCCSAAHIPFLLQRRSELSYLVCTLLQPFKNFEGHTFHPDIIKSYTKWVNRFGTMYIFYHVLFLTCLLMVLAPLFTLLLYSGDTAVNNWPLPAGQIPFRTDSLLVYVVAYIVSASAIISAGMFNSSWHLTMIVASLHVRSRLRMMTESLERLDEKLERPEAGYSGDLIRSRERDACDYLAETADRHVEIMQLVRLFNRCFSMTLLVLFQSSMVIIALLVLQCFDRENYETRELLSGINLTSACLVFMGVFNYIGQTIINESENLKRAMYACVWYSRSKQFKTSLRIMMTASSRYLCLTVGGLYPLSMESYGNILKAVYSYVNILLSLQNKKYH